MNAQDPHRPHRPHRVRWIGLLAIATLGLFALGAAAPGFGHCGKHGAFAEDPAAAAAFVADKMADHAEATPEQEDAIEDVLTELFTSLSGMRAERETMRAQLRDALTADRVDPAELERLRSETLQRLDGASLEVTAALGELAGILTPEQRLALSEQVDRMHERWQR